VRNIFILLTIIIYSSKSFSTLPRIVQCLAQEESLLHEKKIRGPSYKLNQDTVNLLAIENKLTFKKAIIEKVCKSNSKAFTLMEIILLNDREEIFQVPELLKNDYQLISYAKQMNLMISKFYDIFLNYISKVQVRLTHPRCLSFLINGFDEYLIREKHLKGRVAQYNDKESYPVIKEILDTTGDIEALQTKCKKIK